MEIKAESDFASNVIPNEPQIKTNDLINAIPELKEVEHFYICGAFCRKDGLLLFHFYLPKRREIFKQAEAIIDGINQQKLDEDSTNRLKKASLQKIHIQFSENPWPKEFGAWLLEAMNLVFKYQSIKTGYYEEVDSWSGALQEAAGIQPYSDEMCRSVFSIINEKFSS